MTRGPILEKSELDQLVAEANRGCRSGYRNAVIGPKTSEPVRFELYHAAPSLCSHKIRTLLAELDIPYVSHAMNIMPAGKSIPENYLPGYVKLRMKGSEGGPLVSGYTGESSVTQQGFDPCVVPTLVDHQARRVVIDSQDICAYIDEETGGRLTPPHLQAEIARLVALVDRAPHVALLYGAHPDGDIRPPGLATRITGVHARKLRVLEALIEHVGEDPELLDAYRSKMAKEAAAGEFMMNADGMRATHVAFAEHVAALEAELATHDKPWVCGDAFTMADILWTASLYRVEWIGLGHLWTTDGMNSRVADYVSRAFARPSFRAGVADWPGAYAPSPHQKDNPGSASEGQFTLHMLRSMKWLEMTFGHPQIKLKPLAQAPSNTATRQAETAANT